MTERNLLASGWISMALLFLVATTSSAEDIVRNERPSSWRVDAELTDVFFLNEQLGWAVGAQGVILRTTDGGDHWTQYSNIARANQFDSMSLTEKLRNSKPLNQGTATVAPTINCRFESVHFVDAQHGWVAGGYEIPYVDRNFAILFRTKDGGLTWQQVDGLLLPSIVKIRFENRFEGWALAKPSNLYPSGLLFSKDGGRSWSSQTGERSKGWQTTEKTTAGFVALDLAGQLAVLKNNRVEPAAIVTREPTRFSAIQMASERTGFAVGKQGALFQTENGGEVWTKVLSPESSPSLSTFDFRAVTQIGNKVWFAGNPGTRLYCFDTETRQLSYEDIALFGRINQIAFVDDLQGWLVGDMGTIIATRDGGRSWQRQRGSASRLSLMLVSQSPETLPLHLVAKFGGEEGYLVGSVCGLNPADDRRASIREATERIGGCVTEFVAKSDLDVRQLCRSIRTLRPNVIVTEEGPRFRNVIQSAIRAAADRQAFPEQIVAGLESWQVDRIGVPDNNGNFGFSTKQILTGCGQTVEDQIAVSAALLNQKTGAFQLVSESTGEKRVYRLDSLSMNAIPNATNLFQSLENQGSRLPSRMGGKDRRGNLGLLRQVSQKNTTLTYLASWPVDGSVSAQTWRSAVARATETLPSEIAGVWLTQLADLYLDQGKPGLAADTLQFIASRWAEHPFSPAARQWLIHFQASGEFAAATRKEYELAMAAQASKNDALVRPTTVNEGGEAKTTWIVRDPKDENVVQASLEQPVANEVDYEEFLRQRWQRASQFMARLRSRDPDMAVDQNLRLVEAQLNRRLNSWTFAENLFRQISKRIDAVDQASVLAARREIFLAGRPKEDSTHRPPRENRFENESWYSIVASERPRLDGLLDDLIWKEAIANRQSLVINHSRARDGKGNDEVLFRHDSEFLYLAVRCRKIQGQFYQEDAAPRPRDPDLTGQDRIEIGFDVDRDYGSAFTFVIDHRGWVAESCCGTKGWNPDWYVKASGDEQYWTAEIAIPFDALGVTPEQGDVWAIQMQRMDYASQPVWKTARPSPNDRRNSAAGPVNAESEVHSDSLAQSDSILNTLKPIPFQYRLFEFR